MSCQIKTTIDGLKIQTANYIFSFGPRLAHARRRFDLETSILAVLCSDFIFFIWSWMKSSLILYSSDVKLFCLFLELDMMACFCFLRPTSFSLMFSSLMTAALTSFSFSLIIDDILKKRPQVVVLARRDGRGLVKYSQTQQVYKGW